MTKGEIVGNIVFIYVKYRGAYKMSKINITSLHMSMINISRWRLLNVLFLVILNTLSLKEFLPYIPNSNWRKSDMVGNFIPRPFQWYMEVPLNP
jgi:hypothetical protein